MENLKDILKILFLIFLAVVTILVLIHFQKKNVNVQHLRPLTIEEKVRFKGGLEASS